MFEVTGNKGSPVVNYEGVSKNVMGVGFQEEGRWMYTGIIIIWPLQVVFIPKTYAKSVSFIHRGLLESARPLLAGE